MKSKDFMPREPEARGTSRLGPRYAYIIDYIYHRDNAMVSMSSAERKIQEVRGKRVVSSCFFVKWI